VGAPARPPQLLPGGPDAVVDLQTAEGVALVGGQWRWTDTTIDTVDFTGPGADLGPGGEPVRTHEIRPAGGALDVDTSGWRTLAPEETGLRLSSGRVCFAWYRIELTVPDRIGALDPTGCTLAFEIVVDDAAEVWVNGALPLWLGRGGGQVSAGFNAPNRFVLTRDARPGQRFTIAVFGINGPISAAPANYIWIRSATLDVYTAEHAAVGEPVDARIRRLDPRLDEIIDLAPDPTSDSTSDSRADWSTDGTVAAQRVAAGFEFTEGPVWTPDGALLFSAPNTNTVYRWHPDGVVDVFRAKSGYAGTDIGRYHQPGSNGLAFDPQGRLTLCQHGNRRVLRVEPRGNTTVLADSFGGRRLNSPNDLVYRSDGVLLFTDPPFGLPGGAEDPKRELPFSGVFAVVDGAVRLVTDELRGPNGIALSPDEQWLYVGDWDPDHKAVVRYPLRTDASVGPGELLRDLTAEPGEDAIDGLAVDALGNVLVCGPGGIWVLAPDGGRLGLVELPEPAHNLTWGDDDRRTLYVTALDGVYRLRTKTGAPVTHIEGMRPTSKEKS
jgi:gluconolactonase